MRTALEFPSPRDELDSGSVSELVEDCRALVVPHTVLPVRQPRHVEIDVPDEAARLLLGLGDYGS
jgi:hypothetical protein